MDAAGFREALPEFASSSAYPDAQLAFWSDFVESSTDPDVCGDLYDTLIYLGTAHYITLAHNNALSASAGASPGTGGGGLISSKSVGSVSVSYAHNLTANTGADDWNKTTYGQQYWRSIRMLGAGAYVAC